MIFLDANYFLRYLVEPDGPGNETRRDIAAALFEAIESGEEEATTSDAALAEVAFILASKRQYNLPAADVAAYLSPIIRLPGLRLPRGRKRLYLRALEIWSEHSSLGFVDSLTAASVEHSALRLATFDADFDNLPNIQRWQPSRER
ncbi:MAG: type II toxin-antitoxin system VapC family toxin [Chloroflexi bacterium]|nr:type II toxin-antitoxin system VapC family toxin [Chloroflexota bacterium]